MRQAFAEQLARGGGFELGADLVDDLHIVGVLVAVDHHQRVGVGLAQQVLGLMHLVGGVDRHQHRADAGAGPEGNEPLGDIRRPDGHVVALLYAHGDEGAGKLVHVVAELGVGARVVAGGVAEGVLVGEFLHHAVEHLGEGEVDQVLLGPEVLAGAAVVRLQALGGVGLHKVGEVREDDAGIGKVGHPALDPFQGDEAVKVDGGEAIEHLVDGQVALAHHLVDDAAVFHHGVLGVDVADVSAEVPHRGLRIFAEKAVGMVDVPQSGDLRAVYPVEQPAQAGGVAIDAVGLHQQRDVLALGDVGQLQKRPGDLVVVHFALGGGVAVGEHADIGRAQLVGQLDVLGDLEDGRLAVFLVLQRRVGGETGDSKSQIAQLLNRLVDAAGRKGRRRHSMDVAADAAHLDAVKLKILGHGVDVHPVKIRTSER